MTRVVVTRIGGLAGVALFRSLLKRADIDAFAADVDGWASGPYLIDADRRRIVPAGRSEDA